MREALLEPLLRRMRMRRVMPYVRQYPACHLLDVGCGANATLLRALEAHVGSGTGVDFKAPDLHSDKLRTVSLRLDRALPFADASFDLITMLAVLEHLDHPQAILNECARLLRPGGGLLLTVPSWHAKPVLQFLAFQLGVVSRDEIADHKRYFDRADLYAMFQTVPDMQIVSHHYFQWRFNNCLFAVKAS